MTTQVNLDYLVFISLFIYLFIYIIYFATMWQSWVSKKGVVMKGLPRTIGLSNHKIKTKHVNLYNINSQRIPVILLVKDNNSVF